METNDLLNELLQEFKIFNQIHKEIDDSLKIMARSEIENRLKNIFTNSDEIRVYELSNGENPTTEIEKHVAISASSISRLWKKWEEEYGIVESEGYHNPYRAKYSLVGLALFFGKPTTEITTQDIEEGK